MATNAPGYAYAARSHGAGPNRIKIGVLSSLDPVGALQEIYSRAMGKVEVLWLLPVAKMKRDEDRVHKHLSHHRVWERHEIFSFQDDIQLHDLLRSVTGVIGHTNTPPTVPDLENSNGQCAKMASRKVRKAELCVNRRKKQLQKKDDAVTDWIARNCTIGPGMRVEAKIFNAAVHHLKRWSVRAFMAKQGFVRKQGVIDKQCSVWIYDGLRLNT